MKALKLIGIGFGCLILGSIVVGIVAGPSNGRQLAFINDGAEPLEVILYPAGGKNSVSYQEVAPRSCTYEWLPPGRYDISIFQGDRYLRGWKSYEIPPQEQKNASDYFCIDLTGQHRWALVDAGFLYQARGSVAASVRESLGLNSTRLIRKIFEAGRPFITATPGQIELIKPFEKLPEEIDLGDQLLVLMSLPADLPGEAIPRHVVAALTRDPEVR